MASIVIPSVTRVSASISEERREAFVEGVVRMVAEMVGGATVTHSTGYWIAQDNDLVKEKVSVVEGVCMFETRIHKVCRVKHTDILASCSDVIIDSLCDVM